MMDWIVDHPIPGILGIITTTVVVMVGSVVLINYSNGVVGFGPEYVNQVTINRLYVDGGRSSHYMVGTDKGVYEIKNFLYPVQIYNCDELYSKLEVGKTYLVLSSKAIRSPIGSCNSIPTSLRYDRDCH